jgi:hypothetical protein
MQPKLSIYKLFQQSDDFFETLGNSAESKAYFFRQVFLIFLFSLLYGIIMGSYNGFLQALVTGIKIPSLIFLSLLICFPALFVIQYMIGSSMSFYQMGNTILSGFLVFTTISLSFSPIVVFFMITSKNYAFLKLLHVAIFAFSGVFAITTIIKGLTYSCERKNIYPKQGMNVFKIWIVIFAFVASQLAWNLRPFLGTRNLPFALFREHEGNFYVAVIQSVKDMADGSGNEAGDAAKQAEPKADSSLIDTDGR